MVQNSILNRILNWIPNIIRPAWAILVQIPNEKVHGFETAAP